MVLGHFKEKSRSISLQFDHKVENSVIFCQHAKFLELQEELITKVFFIILDTQIRGLTGSPVAVHLILKEGINFKFKYLDLDLILAFTPSNYITILKFNFPPDTDTDTEFLKLIQSIANINQNVLKHDIHLYP